MPYNQWCVMTCSCYALFWGSLDPEFGFGVRVPSP